jgi:hypothetical protein
MKVFALTVITAEAVPVLVIVSTSALFAVS